MRESRSSSSSTSSAAPPAGLRPPAPAPRRRGAPCGRRPAPSRPLLIAGLPGVLGLLRDLRSPVRRHLGLLRGLPGLAGGLFDLSRSLPRLVRRLLDLI